MHRRVLQDRTSASAYQPDAGGICNPVRPFSLWQTGDLSNTRFQPFLLVSSCESQLNRLGTASGGPWISYLGTLRKLVAFAVQLSIFMLDMSYTLRYPPTLDVGMSIRGVIYIGLSMYSLCWASTWRCEPRSAAEDIGDLKQPSESAPCFCSSNYWTVSFDMWDYWFFFLNCYHEIRWCSTAMWTEGNSEDFSAVISGLSSHQRDPKFAPCPWLEVWLLLLKSSFLPSHCRLFLCRWCPSGGFIIWWRKPRDTLAAFQSPTALAPPFLPVIQLSLLSSEESTSSPAPALPSSCSLFHIWRIPDMLRNLLLFQFPPNFIACSNKVFWSPSRPCLLVCSNLNTKSVLECIVAACLLYRCAPYTLFSVSLFTIPFSLCIFFKWIRNWSWIGVGIVCEPKDRPFSRQKKTCMLVTSCQSKKELVHPKSLHMLDWLALCVMVNYWN